MTTPAGRFRSSRRTWDYLVRAAWNHVEQADRDAWAHGLALRWGLVRTPEALTPQEAAQTILMTQSRLDVAPGLVYRGPSELHIGDLAQLAELMPYLVDLDGVPTLTLAWAWYREREATERRLTGPADDRFED